MEQVITAETGEHFSITRATEQERHEAEFAIPYSREPQGVQVTYEMMPLADIADEVINTDERIAEARRSLEIMVLYKQSLQNELLRRMKADNATAIPSTDYIIECKQAKKLVKNDAVFREIEFLTAIPANERAEMFRTEQPPPVVKTDATALKKYAKKYGGALAGILERALTYVEGPAEVVVKRRTPELPQ